MTTGRKIRELGIDRAEDLFDKCWERIKLGLEVEHERLERKIDDGEKEAPSSPAVFKDAEAELISSQPATDQAVLNADEADITAPPSIQDAAKPSEEEANLVSPQPVKQDVLRAAENPDDRLFVGEVRLEIVPSYGWNEGEGVPGWLREVPGLRVTASGGYYGVNRWITTCTVSLDQPTRLLSTLKAMTRGEVREHDGNILIKLR